MYRVGDKVVHTIHGLGTIDSIEEKSILGQVARFAVLSFQDDRLRILVNLSQQNSPIRPAIRREQVDEVLEYLRTWRSDLPSAWSTRRNINLEKVKSCDIFRLSEVVKDLIALSHEKKLTDIQQAMLDRSLANLAAELSYVSGRDEAEMVRAIQEACCAQLQEKALLSA